MTTHPKQTKPHQPPKQNKQHHELSVLHTSKPSPNNTSPGQIAHEIRYLSLFDNAYLRFFTGHEQRVSSLSMSAGDDRFLSASVDGTVRLWTLQQPTVRCGARAGGRRRREMGK